MTGKIGRGEGKGKRGEIRKEKEELRSVRLDRGRGKLERVSAR